MEKPHPLKVIGIMFILFGLPLGSWLFMKSGADFRMSAIEELADFGEIQELDLLKSNGERFTNASVSKKVLMVSYLPEKNIENSDKAKRLKWIQEQFQERILKRDDFLFLSPIVTDSLSDLTQIRKNLEAEKSNYRRWEIVGGDKQTLENLAKNSFKFPLKENESAFNNPYMAIVDTKMRVRQFYNIFENEDVAKLIKHLSILLPQKDDRKVEIKTEIENQ